MKTSIAPPYSPGSRRSRIIFWVLMGFAAFYLLAEHRLHMAGLLRWLPMLILLACPLLHLFGHGRHDGPEPDRAVSNDAPQASDAATPPTHRQHTRQGDLP